MDYLCFHLNPDKMTFVYCDTDSLSVASSEFYIEQYVISEE